MRVEVSLVRVEFVIIILLVMLHPSTVWSIDTTIDTRLVVTNGRQNTVLIHRLFADIHTAWVTHTVRLSTAINRSHTIRHVLVNTITSGVRTFTVHHSRWCIHVATIEIRNTWRRVSHVHELRVIDIHLVTGRCLRHRLSGNETLTRCAVKAIRAKTGFRAICSSHSLLMRSTRCGTRHTLSTTTRRRTTFRKVRRLFGLVVTHFTNFSTMTTTSINRRATTTRESSKTVRTSVHWVHTEDLLITTK